MENLVNRKIFWKNKKVLITGHTGFKGSWLSLWLQNLESNLVGFSDTIPTNPSLFEIASVGSNMKSLTGDMRNYNSIQNLIDEFKPEIIFHMAAQSLVSKSYDSPLETFSTNILGTVNLFESIRKSNNPCVIINVTSDKCYDNSKITTSFNEKDPMGGYDPYSCSKGCAELVTSSFRTSFFNPNDIDNHQVALASVRAGNVIGGGDWSEDRLIPDIMKNILNETPLKIRNPDAVRPWQFVLEPLNGYMLLAEKMWDQKNLFSEAWNFGPDDTDLKTVSQILDLIQQVWSKKIEWEKITNNTFHESNYLMLNCNKAKTKLNWKPKTTINQTIQFIVDWYGSYTSGENMKDLCKKQIETFEKLS